MSSVGLMRPRCIYLHGLMLALCYSTSTGRGCVHFVGYAGAIGMRCPCIRAMVHTLAHNTDAADAAHMSDHDTMM